MAANETKPKWERRGEFINIVLALGMAHGEIDIQDFEFNGVAGEEFDDAVGGARDGSSWQREECLKAAIELGAPVDGLKNDSKFGKKWAEVVALCKEVQPEAPENNGAKPKIVYDGGH